MKVGNSIGVTIPVKFIKSVGIKPGDLVEVRTVLETGQVIFTFKGTKQLSLANSFPSK